MFCKNCGCEISDRAKVCHHCGKKIIKQDLRKNESHPVCAPPNKNKLAIVGFVIALTIAIAGLIFNILIFKNVKTVGEIVGFCLAIIAVAIAGFICSFVGYRKADKSEFENLARAGIVLSIIITIVTLIFLIYDIIDLNTLHYVPVHS
ncbi:MAG: zinc ribbon domain-containing protein [Clostridia bacterium]|nr:zinc ribbon domain-containing protein [Clostridia bacterium]